MKKQEYNALQMLRGGAKSAKSEIWSMPALRHHENPFQMRGLHAAVHSTIGLWFEDRSPMSLGR